MAPGNRGSRKQQRKLSAALRPSSAHGNAAYDVAVIGGGAAGLSAALVLGRARRRVAVVDAGTPRNAPAAHMQGFLSRDGMPPADLLAPARAEVVGYGVEIIEDRWSRSTRLHAPLGRRPVRDRATAPRRDRRTTSCPTSPAPASAGAETSSTAPTATAGRCATSRRCPRNRARLGRPRAPTPPMVGRRHLLHAHLPAHRGERADSKRAASRSSTAVAALGRRRSPEGR